MRKILGTAIICLFIVGMSSALVFAEKSENGLFDVDFDVKGWGGLKKGKNIVFLEIEDAAGNAVEGAEIEITPWMPEMNHGTPYRSKIHDLGGGKYRTNVPLTMGGTWEIRIKIKAGNNEDTVTLVFDDVKE